MRKYISPEAEVELFTIADIRTEGPSTLEGAGSDFGEDGFGDDF